MSSSVGQEKTVFLTDGQHAIATKVKKYAFSGARGTTKEDCQRLGADLNADVSYQYLTFFLEDDARLAEIGAKYSEGKMLTGEVKDELIAVLQAIVARHQHAKAKVTPEELAYYMSPDPRRFQERSE